MVLIMKKTTDANFAPGLLTDVILRVKITVIRTEVSKLTTKTCRSEPVTKVVIKPPARLSSNRLQEHGQQKNHAY